MSTPEEQLLLLHNYYNQQGATPAELYEQAVLALSPYIWYRFAEPSGAVAADSSGNGRDAAIANAGAYAQAGAGEATGVALRYNKTTTLVSRTGEIRPAAFTYVWLFKPTDAGETNFGRFIDVLGARFLLQFNGALSSLFARVNSTVNATVTSDVGLSAAQWSMLAATYDHAGDKLIRLYKSTGGDFAELTYSSQVAGSGTQQAGSGTTLVIGNASDSSLTLNGDLDEFIAWHSVLSLAQLNSIASAANFP